jgi:hypothetical protein
MERSRASQCSRRISATPETVDRGSRLVYSQNHMTSITQDGSTNVVPLLVAGTTKRTLVTPSQAVALFQTSRGGIGAQDINIAAGVATAGSVVTFNQADINGVTFTGFAIPAGTTVEFTGARPTVTLPSATTWLGTVSFPTAGTIGYLNLGAAATVIGTSGALTGSTDSTIILSGSGGSFTNNGLVSVNELAIARTSSGALTFHTTATGTTEAVNLAVNPRILIGESFDVGLGFTFKATQADGFSLPIEFGNLNMPTVYASNVTALAKNANTLRTVALTFAMSGDGNASIPVTVGGTIGDVKSITIKGTTVSNGTVKINSDINIADDASFTSRGNILISNTANLNIGNDVDMTAGVLKSTAPDWNSNTLITSADIATAGSITFTVTGGALTIGNGGVDGFFIANGGNVKGTSTSTANGAITIGNDNLIRAMGGNVEFLTMGTITGGTGNDIQAKGKLGVANGGIEMAGGTTKSTLNAAFGQPAGTNTANFNGTVVGGANGVARALLTGTGTVNLNGSTIDLTQRGAVNFDSSTPNGVVFGTSNTFTTKSSKPVATQAADTHVEYVVDTDEDGWLDEQVTDESSATRIRAMLP